jgi:hypothetical protein
MLYTTHEFHSNPQGHSLLPFSLKKRTFSFFHHPVDIELQEPCPYWPISSPKGKQWDRLSSQSHTSSNLMLRTFIMQIRYNPFSPIKHKYMKL